MKAELLLAALGLAAAGIVLRAARHDAPAPARDRTDGAHRRYISADGNLRAVENLAIDVPEVPGLGRPLRLAWLAPDGSAVGEGDVLARFDPTDADAAVVTADAAVATADASLADTKLKAAAADAARARTAEVMHREAAQTRAHRPTDPLLASRADIREGELDEHVADATAAQADRARALEHDAWRAVVAISQLGADRARVQQTEAAAARTKLELHAPRAGVFVVHRDEHGDPPKLGAQLCCSQPLGELPAPGAMEAVLFVLEADASPLAPGQPVDLVVASRPDTTYRGTIRAVDATAHPRVVWAPMQYVGVVVALERTDPAVMKSGARVHGAIRVGAP